MSELLFGHDQTVADWVAKQGNVVPFTSPYSAFGILNNGRLVGGFVFTGFNGHNIEISLAGKSVATRGAMRAVLNYVFDQLKCSRMQMHTRRNGSDHIRKQLHKLGIPFEGIARRYYGREDAVCFSLVKDDLEKFKMRWKL